MTIKEALTHIKQLQVGGALTEQDIIAIAIVAAWIEEGRR